MDAVKNGRRNENAAQIQKPFSFPICTQKMFTGLIEEIGTIQRVEYNSTTQQTILIILAKLVLEDVQLGDSIAVNGVCLTVTAFTKTTFTVGLSAETLQRTTFKSLKAGMRVNLERSVKSNTRMGGHYVQVGVLYSS